MPEGRLEGRGIVAKTHDGLNADSMTIGPDGTGTGDYRGSVTTGDGAVIYLHGQGRADLSRGLAEVPCSSAVSCSRRVTSGTAG
jgi:hypothetical protein